jgi:replicative DNA helicase
MLKKDRIKELLENCKVVQESVVSKWLYNQGPFVISQLYRTEFGKTLPSINKAIAELSQVYEKNPEKFEYIKTIAYESINKRALKEADALEDKVKTTFDVLDEARQSVQDAQASLVINLPGSVQDLYKTELASIYEKCDRAIQEIINLAKKIHNETNR